MMYLNNFIYNRLLLNMGFTSFQTSGPIQINNALILSKHQSTKLMFFQDTCTGEHLYSTNR